MVSKLTSDQEKLTRWVGWFFFWNTVVLVAIGASYLTAIPVFSQIPELDTAGRFVGMLFIILATIGQAAIFAFSGAMVAYITIRYCPKRQLIVLLSLLMASLIVLFLTIDTITFHLYYYHFLDLVWNILISGAFSQVLVLSPMEWLSLVLITIGVLSFETLLAYWVWSYLERSVSRHRGRLIAVSLSTCLLLSYIIYFSAAYLSTENNALSTRLRMDDRLIMSEARALPYYLDAHHFLKNSASGSDLVVQSNKALRYPRKPIVAKPKHAYNILIIAIDSWRHDMLNARVTPNISEFSKQAINFANHYSGGNGTQPGIFSLFYGLPSTYWTAVLQKQQGPVFIKELEKQNYQLGIYASAELNFPEFDKTVFHDVADLQVYTQGENAADRDRVITHQFIKFLNRRDHSRPFFGFLFYDAAHAYCENGDTYEQAFKPSIAECNHLGLDNSTNPVPYLNRYKNAVAYDDRLIGRVLTYLAKAQLLENTIVIITADHGEEFNDEHLNYWGHASAFDPIQLRTPMIVHWPKKGSGTVYYQTSHYDVVPTLMQKALGVTTSPENYSVGRSLFSDNPPGFLIVGSYEDYALMEPNKTTIFYSDGNYDVTYPEGYPYANVKLDPLLVHQANELMTSFYR